MCKMTVLVVVGVALFVSSCTDSGSGNRVSSAESDSPELVLQDQLFDRAIVDRFRTTDFTSFLGKDSITFRANNLGGILFGMQPGYVGGGTLRSSGRGVGIAVFESAQTALDAVEARRKGVANVISKSQQKRNGISHWWFSETQALLSIVHGNMVVEVVDLHKHYSEIEKELWATAMGFLKTAEQKTERDK